MKLALRNYPFIFLALFIWSCSGTRYLEDGEKWLYKQNIEGAKSLGKDPMLRLVTLKPNTRIPIIGPLGANLYESGYRKWDSLAIVNKIASETIRYDSLIAKKDREGKNSQKLINKKNRKLDKLDKKRQIGNFRMRTGSPLSRYDSTAIENSRQRIENYLRDKGFRSAQVSISMSEKNNKITQNFIVSEGERSFIDSTLLRTGDPAIAFLLQSKADDSFLKKGSMFDRDNIDRERARLEGILRNSGYYEINERFINFEVYFAPNQSDLWINTVINKPIDKSIHKAFKLDSITINTQGNLPIRKSDVYDTIKYNYGSTDYNPKVLDSRIKISPGEKYNFDNIRNTQRQLLNMNIFRYVNINFDTTIVPGKFVTNIYTAPQRKYQLTQEVGLNMTEGVPGPFYNVSLLNRNIFGGAEILQIGGFIGSEGVSGLSGQSGVFSSFQYGGNLSLTFPRFNIPFSNNKFSKRVFNATNTALIGYSFIDRPEYTRTNLNGRWGYSWQNETGRRSFTFNLLDMNLIDTKRIDPEFQKLLDDLLAQGNNLALSFNPSFVSSSSFNAIYNFDYGNPLRPSSLFRYLAEMGGNLTSIFGGSFFDQNDLEYYQFSKLQVDYRRHIPLANNKAWVLRAHTGVAYAYGSNAALPYEKYFFTGGSNSNRAWSPRRLGPGSSFPYLLDEEGNNVVDENGDFVPNRAGPGSYQFEQPGEILLELNAEYRAKLSGLFDWAAFVDAGNIWRFQEFTPLNEDDPVRSSPGASFEWNRFYKEIAVGLGLGLRLDLSFLVFRVDYGVKIRDPRFPEKQRWQVPFKRGTQTVWNVAVGYAF